MFLTRRHLKTFLDVETKCSSSPSPTNSVTDEHFLERGGEACFTIFVQLLSSGNLIVVPYHSFNWANIFVVGHSDKLQITETVLFFSLSSPLVVSSLRSKTVRGCTRPHRNGKINLKWRKKNKFEMARRNDDNLTPLSDDVTYFTLFWLLWG